MTDNGMNRRKHTRLPLNCGVKVYDPFSRRYRAGVTRNVSAGGALLELHGSLYARPGQRLDVAVDWTGSRPLVPSAEMASAIVVRVDTSNATVPLVAIRYAASGEMAAAA